jgi:hypothetical protein
MAYLPDGTPTPEANPDDRPFWEACARRELRIQRCASCGRHRHPPMPRCPACRSREVEWHRVSGEGEVFSYTIVHHAVHPALRSAVPFNVVVVLLDGTGDVRLVSNVIDAKPEELVVGLRVSLVWDAIPGGALPRFRKAPSSDSSAGGP